MTHYSKIMSLALVNAKKLIIECSATAYTMYIDKKYAHTLQEPASRTKSNIVLVIVTTVKQCQDPYSGPPTD